MKSIGGFSLAAGWVEPQARLRASSTQYGETHHGPFGTVCPLAGYALLNRPARRTGETHPGRAAPTGTHQIQRARNSPRIIDRAETIPLQRN
jgi:hypothetical protein